MVFPSAGARGSRPRRWGAWIAFEAPASRSPRMAHSSPDALVSRCRGMARHKPHALVSPCSGMARNKPDAPASPCSGTARNNPDVIPSAARDPAAVSRSLAALGMTGIVFPSVGARVLDHAAGGRGSQEMRQRRDPSGMATTIRMHWYRVDAGRLAASPMRRHRHAPERLATIPMSSRAQRGIPLPWSRSLAALGMTGIVFRPPARGVGFAHLVGLGPVARRRPASANVAGRPEPSTIRCRFPAASCSH